MIELDDIVRIVVAVGFLAAAGAKIVLTRPQLERMGMSVIAELAPTTRWAIALVELVGAAALLGPWLFGTPPWTVRLAAAGLTVLLTGASWLQVTRRRAAGAAISITMLVLTASLAVTPTVPVGLP